jgi:hypothetical protein
MPRLQSERTGGSGRAYDSTSTSRITAKDTRRPAPTRWRKRPPGTTSREPSRYRDRWWRSLCRPGHSSAQHRTHVDRLRSQRLNEPHWRTTRTAASCPRMPFLGRATASRALCLQGSGDLVGLDSRDVSARLGDRRRRRRSPTRGLVHCAARPAIRYFHARPADASTKIRINQIGVIDSNASTHRRSRPRVGHVRRP